MERKIITPEALAEELKKLDEWTASDTWITKKIEFSNFAEALAYVNQVGALAEAADHHPDITFGWGYAEIALTTHDRGGVTDVDLALAGEIDALTN